MPDRVRETDPPHPPFDRIAVERPQGGGIRPGRVFGDKHDGQPLPHTERHRLLGRTQHVIQGPPFGVAAYRRAADKGGNLDRNTRHVRYPHHRFHVAQDGAGRTVGGDCEPGITDLLAQTGHVGHGSRASGRKPDIRGVNAEFVHHVDELDLRANRRIDDRRRLKSVPQRLVVQLDVSAPRQGVELLHVPVMNQAALVHSDSVPCRAKSRLATFLQPQSRLRPVSPLNNLGNLRAREIVQFPADRGCNAAVLTSCVDLGQLFPSDHRHCASGGKQ